MAMLSLPPLRPRALKLLVRRPGYRRRMVWPQYPVHSRRDLFSVDYGLWPFHDKDYNIVCTVTNLAVNTDLSLWAPLLNEEARR